MMFSKHSSYVSASLISLIIKLQMQKKIVVFFLEFNIHLFTVDLFQYMTKEKKSLFHVKTDYYPCSCREVQKDAGTVNLQMTYVADVITAVARQTYVWCMAIVRQKYSSHGHCTLRVATRLQTKLYVTLTHVTTGTSNVRLSYVTLLIISMRFLTLRSATGATTGKTLIHDHQTRTLTYSQKINYIGK